MLRIILGSGGTFIEIFVTLLSYICAILGAIIIHEIAHGFIALKNGDYTAKLAGRLSLNPAKHFDLMGMAMFVIVGFGWARPVPVDTNNFRHQKKGIITVALAGVTANLIMATVGAGLFALCSYIAEVTQVSLSSFGGVILYFFYSLGLYGMIINISLIAFNILPIFPLDGFRVVEGLTKPFNKYCVWMRKYGVFLLFGLMIFSSILGAINQYCDIFGLYIGAVRNGILWLFGKIFGFTII